jgi:hypothetical protein
MIVATAVRIAMMIVATAAMIARTAVGAPGCCGDSHMGGPDTKPIAHSPLSRTARVHKSVIL